MDTIREKLDQLKQAVIDIEDAIAIAEAEANKAAPAEGTYKAEWKGETHVVVRGEDGYVYKGRVYRSLSAIARKIKGYNENGPRFFGVSAKLAPSFPRSTKTQKAKIDAKKAAAQAAAGLDLIAQGHANRALAKAQKNHDEAQEKLANLRGRYRVLRKLYDCKIRTGWPVPLYKIKTPWLKKNKDYLDFLVLSNVIRPVVTTNTRCTFISVTKRRDLKDAIEEVKAEAAKSENERDAAQRVLWAARYQARKLQKA